MKIYLMAVIKSKPAHTAEVKQVLEHMTVQSRQEEACLQYDLHQGSDDKNVFVFHEIWTDEAGLDRHNEQPYIKAFGALAENKLQEKPIIYRTEKV